MFKRQFFPLIAIIFFFVLSCTSFFLQAEETADVEPFKVTVGQIVLTTPEEVLDQIEKTYRENPESELFVFAEFVTHGDKINLDEVAYLEGDEETRKVAQKWIDLTPKFGSVKALAKKYNKATVVGCLEQEDGKLYSRAYFYDPQTDQLEYYDKTHVHWTEKLLRPGKKLEPFDTRFGKIGILICYDMAFVEPTRVYGLKGADILVVVSAVPLHFHWKYPHRRMTGAAMFNQYYVVSANQGYSLLSKMGGYSGIYSPDGDLLAMVDNTKYGYITAEIDLDLQKKWREEEVIYKYRIPGLYDILDEEKGELDKDTDKDNND